MGKWMCGIVMCAVCLLLPVSVFAQGPADGRHKDRFVTVGDRQYYYNSAGKRAAYTGWKTINGRKYYFHKKHYVVKKKGWQTIRGERYYFGAKGVMYSQRWVTLKGKRYYLLKSGKMARGWAEYKGGYYYFAENGELERNTIARSRGRYYLVDAKGRRGADILKGVGIRSSMSKEQKLRKCFEHVIKDFTYLPAEVWPLSGEGPPEGWEARHAYRIMVSKCGNCYDYAVAFCYLARAVGYKRMVCVAGERSDGTGGYRPHGWCELRKKVFDPRLTDRQGRHPYDTPYGSLPYIYRK